MKRHSGQLPQPELIYGLKPVLELLERRRQDVDRIFVARERRAGLKEILALARGAGVPVSHVPREVLARKAGRGAVHQGVAAQVSSLPYADAAEVCAAARDESGVLVLLDGVVDPRNLGAIVRSCAAAGVQGVLLGGEATVGLTPAVVKTSAGTVARVPVAREAHASRRLRALKAEGFTCLALDSRGAVSWDSIDLTGRIIIVAGGEERGLRPGLARDCDTRVAIPLARGVESLNVAVALGVLLFEAVRQRRRSGHGA